MSINISSKPDVKRIAVAIGQIELSIETIELIKSNKIEKGDVFSSARLSAIQAVKNTPNNLFHCHPIPIYGADFLWEISETNILVKVSVNTIGKTGCEMEALSGVTTSLLMIWDMVKKYEKDETGQYPSTRISSIKVISKEKIPVN